MPTNQQRRATERRRLQRQLEQRRAREQSRKRFTLIASIVGTLVVIAAVVVIVVVTTSGGSTKSTAAKGSGSASASPSATPSSSAPPVPVPAADRTVRFDGVTVTSASTLATEPKVTSTSSSTPSTIEVKDIVAGTGAVASTTSNVTVQYAGVLYKNGKAFDSSWSHGQAAQFSLAQTVPGFTKGIGGGDGITPMKVGGRRIIIVPAADGYGDQASSTIPANSTLVFVVDLIAAG